VEFEVIVVDNASSDDSEPYIKEHFPQVRFIRSEENLGFGRANNLGAKYATGKYLFLLNSDTLLENDAISLFFQYMEKHGESELVGAIGCNLLDDKGEITHSYDCFLSPKSEISYLWKKLNKKQTYQLSVQEKDPDYITGADLFICHSLYKRLQGFDPHFFMYCEETDLQFRMAEMGWKRRIIMGPRIVHLEGGSFAQKGLSYTRFLMWQHSYNYYIRKHYHSIGYALFRLTLICTRLFFIIRTNWTLSQKINAYGLVLKGTIN
jgi:hypothetical protein